MDVERYEKEASNSDEIAVDNDQRARSFDVNPPI
jgi:hypothetical protein